MVVPRLDLSKVNIDKDDDDQSSLNEGSNPPNNKDYLDFLENESRLNDNMG